MSKTSCVISIGNFDGVHRGHQLILKELTDLAKLHQVPSKVITFKPHPQSVLDINYEPRSLYELDTKIKALKHFGVDEVIVVNFTNELANMRANNFLDHYVGLGQITAMVQGKNFRFGADGHCGIKCLNGLGSDYGFEIRLMDLVSVSSTLIKNKLKENEIHDAYKLFGHYFYNHQTTPVNHQVEGRVVKGKGYGRKIETPTANIDTAFNEIDDGIYAGVATANNHKHIAGVSVKDGKIEVHIIDYQGDLYGETLKVVLNHYLRSYKEFNRSIDLISQIKRDLLQSWHLLHEKVN